MELSYMEINHFRKDKKERKLDPERVFFILSLFQIAIFWLLTFVAGTAGIQHLIFGNIKYGIFRLGIFLLSFVWKDPDLIIWLSILCWFDYMLMPISVLEKYREDVRNMRKRG